MLKIIGSIKKGANPKVMILFHKALYGSYLAYGSAIYGDTPKTYKEMLAVSSRQCQRIATGCTRTTPINTLAALSNEEPLSLKRHYYAMKKITQHFKKNDEIAEQLRRLQPMPNFQKSKCFTFMEKVYLENSETVQNVYENYEMEEIPKIDVRPQIEKIPINKKKMSTSTMLQIAKEHINTEYLFWRQIYTDASKSTEGCGIGVYESNSETEISLRLEHPTSIMTAELIAIQIALREIPSLETDQFYRNVILTDSQAACQLLLSCQFDKSWDHLTGEICTNLYKTNTVLQWIPGHVGLNGNEHADRLAKTGVQTNAIVVNKLLWVDAIRNYKQELSSATNQWYRDIALRDGKGLKFFEMFSNFPIKPWFWTADLDGEEIRTLNRVLAGHDYSEYWLAKMKLVVNEDCEMCQEKNTTEHCLLKCMKYNHVRNHFHWENYNKLTEIAKNDKELCCVEKLKQILKFIKMANLRM
ncbi:uncharacterized protein LOC129742196 [Uranotaenia lowii]|uniref:uncharacterized protein LOC129742196 n=1 Tax=Uranotaenia lowii TaxID=190385 RepID=UPI00247875C2|nr:uncharacterized protein LOC129742196 [Uranotaenia lowii]